MSNLPLLPMDTIWAIEESRFAQMIATTRAVGSLEAARRPDMQSASALIENRDGVAVIGITGSLSKHASVWQIIFGGVSSVQLREAVQQAAADDAVIAILLNVDSPGGSVEGITELADAVYAARQVKPVQAQIDGMGASAAYFVASQAEKVYAQKMDLIGSIGVRALWYDWSKFFEEAGVKAIPIDTGAYKSAGAMGTEITEKQIAYWQGIVDAFFEDFVAAVVRGRGMGKEPVLHSADGRVFVASEAKERGLIDGIQTFEETLAALQQRVQVAPSASGKGDVTSMEIRNMTGDTLTIDLKAAEPEKGASTEMKQAVGELRVESKAATIAELKASMPDGNADFWVECLEHGLTLSQAKDLQLSRTASWMAKMREQSDADAKKIAHLEAEAEKTSAKSAEQQKADAARTGVQPLTSEATAAGAGGDTGDPIADFNAIVAEKKKAGKSNAKAMSETVKENPELHQAYLDAHNAMHHKGRAIIA